MRITLVQPYITTKATPKQYYNIQSFGLAAELCKLGHEVVILTSNLVRAEVRTLFDRRRRFVDDAPAGFKIIYLPTLAQPGGIPLMPTLAGEIHRSAPDVVQAAEDSQISSLIAVRWGKANRVPTTIYQGMYSEALRHARLRRAYAETLGRVVYRDASAFICKSNAARSFVIGRGVDPDRASVIPVGFKRSNYAKCEEDDALRGYFSSRKEKILLSVGRLVPEKGYDVALRAMKKLVGAHPEIGFVILGDGPEYDRLMGISLDLGISEDVRIVREKILNTEMNKMYGSAYLYLIPSTYEIFNMTMLEALACGSPVIASREGGMQDVVRNGETGFLFEKNDDNELAKRIEEAVVDPELRRTLSEHAMSDASNYDWSIIAKRFETLYKQLLETGRPL
jgi:glycosyltransferase involved in cell wall biosynthesis